MLFSPCTVPIHAVSLLLLLYCLAVPLHAQVERARQEVREQEHTRELLEEALAAAGAPMPDLEDQVRALGREGEG